MEYKNRARIDQILGSTEMRFEGGKPEQIIGIIIIKNALETVIYHILNAQILFFLYSYDTNKLKAYFNNIKNAIMPKNNTKILIIKKWKYPFLTLIARKRQDFLPNKNFKNYIKDLDILARKNRINSY